ncbi:hypothetical protein [Segatella salivae]|nr:hypothetical protein [Segatella salivae]
MVKETYGGDYGEQIEYGKNHPKWLIKHKNVSYIPKRGDIFLWRGHRE